MRILVAAADLEAAVNDGALTGILADDDWGIRGFLPAY